MAVPLALSRAPLQIVSPLTASHVPKWSQWAVYTTYSFLSVGSLPVIFAMTFCDSIGCIVCLNDIDAVSSSGTGLKSRVAASALSF